MSRRFGWVVVVAVIAVSCTDSAEESTTTSSLAIPPVTTSTTVDDGPLPGRMVVINLAGNVVVTYNAYDYSLHAVMESRVCDSNWAEDDGSDPPSQLPWICN